jgi:tripartite-type tricarboxylate transporter receptor subunit TctC
MRKMTTKFNVIKLLALMAIAVFSVAGLSQTATAADWPSQNITFIVPYSPGGGFDTIARVTAKYIEKHLPAKANVVVKNVPGAGTRIGMMEILKSKPDGHTVGIGEVLGLGLGILRTSGQLRGVDVDQISWINRLTLLPMIMSVSEASGFKSPEDIKGKAFRFGTVDASNVLNTAITVEALEAPARLVNYAGTSPIRVAMIQGDCDAYMVNWASGKRMVNASEGKIHALFLAHTERVKGWSEVPTAKELGLDLQPLYYNHYMYGPPNLPAEIMKMWTATMDKVLQDPEWQAAMNKTGYPPTGLTGKALDEEVARVFQMAEKRNDLIKKLGIK